MRAPRTPSRKQWLLTRRLLPSARECYLERRADLDHSDLLTPEERVVLAPLVRRDAVWDSLGNLDALLPPRIYPALRALLAASAALGGYVLAVLAALAYGRGEGSAAHSYVAGYVGVALLLGFSRSERHQQRVLMVTSLATYPLSLGAVGYGAIPAWAVPLFWGLSGAVVAGPGIVILEYVQYRIVYRIAGTRVLRRWRGALTPPEIVAAAFVYLLHRLGDAHAPWRSLHDRRNVMRDLSSMIAAFERGFPVFRRATTDGRPDRQRIRWRFRHVGATLREMRLRMVEVNDASSYRELCREIAAAASAAAQGDWSLLMREKEPHAWYKRRAVRRLWPAAALVAAAAALLFVPGVETPQASGAQVVLLVTAALVATGVGGTTRDTIIQAYRDAGRPMA